MTTITILTHSRSRLAKTWRADGTIAPYDETKNYRVRSEPVADIRELSALLERLERDPHSAVIRGEFKGSEAAARLDPDEHKPGLARKIKALYDDRPRNWVLIEVDNFEPRTDNPIDEYITQCLPVEFHDVTYHWQLSSSAGHPNSVGKLKAHLWFWLKKPVSSNDLKHWAVSHDIPVDKSVFNVVQFHYTAAPVAEPGVHIPIEQRSGLCEGLFGDEVDIHIPYVNGHDVAVVASADDEVDDLIFLGAAKLGWTLDEGRAILFDVPSDAIREIWLNDLASFHHEFDGSQEALEVAIEWCETASNFASRKDVEDRWASFGKFRGGNPLTGRWLLKRRAECLAKRKYAARAEWEERLRSAADEFTLREKVCPDLAQDDRLDDLSREALAQALMSAFKRLGSKYPIGSCRKLIAPRVDARRTGGLPAWAEGWVYVTDDDQFYRIDSQEWLSMQGFNARFNRELSGEGEKNAAWIALEELKLPTVTSAIYLPWAPAAIFELNGVQCVNKYRPSATPEAVAALSATGREAVQVVVRHLHTLAGGRPEIVATLLDWLAHNVQHPGVKVRWAPLIKGVEGDGKTVLGALLASVMGRINVRNVSPKVLGTDFTGWAEGSCIAVLEEIKLTGHNRYDILNALKPFIANDSIEIHPKGKDPRDAINTTNYIAFTNYPDALPLTDTDRRWWIVFTPFSSRKDLTAAVGEDLGAYFDRLHDAIQQHPAELRRWLLDHPISSDFKPNGSAPMTKEKGLMIGMSTSEEDDALNYVLENCEGKRGVTLNLFSSRCMGHALLAESSDLNLQTTARNRLFAKAGFTKLPKKVKWNGEAHVIWVRGHGDSELIDVRSILDETLKNEAVDSESNDLF